MDSQPFSKVAMLAIGDELLRGDVSDLNTPFLARWLLKHGAILDRVVIVPDNLEAIGAELLKLKGQYQTIFTSGGLGPTHDDVTIEAISTALGRRMVVSPEVKSRMEECYNGDVSPSKLLMARIPEGSELSFGAFRWVPVILVEGIYILPGVPEIFAKCVESLENRFASCQMAAAAVYLEVGESLIAEELAAIQRRYPEAVIGSYPSMSSPPLVKLNVVHPQKEVVDMVIGELRAVFGKYLRKA